MEILNDEQVASLLGIAKRTLENRIASRKNHPPFRTIGKRRLWVREEVETWILSRPARQAEPAKRRRGRPTKRELVAEGRA